RQLQTIGEAEATVHSQPDNSVNTENAREHERHILMLSNLTEDITGSNKQLSSSPHELSRSPRGNTTFTSSLKNSFHHRSLSSLVSTTTTSLVTAGASSNLASNKDQFVTNFEGILGDQQFDPNMIVDKPREDTVVDNWMSSDEQNSTHEPTFSPTSVLKNLTNSITTSSTDSNTSNIQKRKQRGRPSSTNATSQKWSMEEVDNLIINPKSFSMWKSILIKRQFILGTLTDLFKMIPSRLFDETSRFKLIDFLVQKKLLVKGNWFCDGKGTSIGGYMKGSPANPDVAMSLANLGLDIEEYKLSLNPHHNVKRRIDGKMLNQSYLFNDLLKEQIINDEWFKDNLEIDESLIYATNKLSQTTSNYQIDRFQQQQKEKIKRTMANKRKKAEELQRETLNVCGTDIPVKRKRKPKIRED
ncbi:unnamed protein product, partial [Rotaria sp. Silwood1]